MTALEQLDMLGDIIDLAAFVIAAVFLFSWCRRNLPWRRVLKRVRAWWPVSRSPGRGWL